MKIASQIGKPDSQETPSLKGMTDKSEQMRQVIAEVKEKFPQMIKGQSYDDRPKNNSGLVTLQTLGFERPISIKQPELET